MKYIKFSKGNVKKIACVLSFFVGIFITMPIVSFGIKGRNVSAYSILFIVFLCALTYIKITIKRPLVLNKLSKYYLIWFVIAIFSSLVGMAFYSSRIEWVNAIYSYMGKIFMYMYFIFIVNSLENKKEIIYRYLNGFIVGCILNLIWANIDGISYYTLGYSINNSIFSRYSELNPGRDFISIINIGGIRVGGFNNDPAHLGGLIPIVAGYSVLKKNYLLTPIIIGALIFSQSTTALVSSILVLIFLNLISLSHNKKRKLISLKNRTSLFGILLTPLLVFFGFYFYQSTLIDAISGNLSGFIDRIDNNYISNESTENIRNLYLLYFPVAIFNNGILSITGSGFGTSSAPYLKINEIYSHYNAFTPYDPENTYISYFFDVGIIGFLLYIYVLVSLIRYFRRNCSSDGNKIVFSSILGITFSCFFYHYILTAYQVFAIISGCLLYNKNDLNISKKSLRESFEIK